MQQFSGELTEWIPFWESFCTAIHDNPTLTPCSWEIQLSTLTPQAYCTRCHCWFVTFSRQLPRSNLNSGEAFGSNLCITAKHMDVIMCFAVVTSPNDLKSLRGLYDGIELHTRNLKSLGVTWTCMVNCWPQSVLMNKLPHGLQLLVSRQINEDDWRLDTVMKEPAEEIQDCERATVFHAHSRVKYNGVRETLTELRPRYWLIWGRNFVRKSLAHCVICKRFEGHAFSPPPPPPLLSFCVSEAPAFTYTGVDLAGPLYVNMFRYDANEIVRICLYICCVIRAIHLEIVMELTTQAFIRCLQHFTARRGIPVKILLDNGLTFKAADKMMSCIINHPTFKEYFTGACVHWTFNLKNPPWWGRIFKGM